MPKGKSITLKGDAARAFVETMKGTPPKNENDSLERIATRVHMEVHTGNMPGAVLLLQLLTKNGADSTAKSLP